MKKSGWWQLRCVPAPTNQPPDLEKHTRRHNNPACSGKVRSHAPIQPHDWKNEWSARACSSRQSGSTAAEPLRSSIETTQVSEVNCAPWQVKRKRQYLNGRAPAPQPCVDGGAHQALPQPYADVLASFLARRHAAPVATKEVGRFFFKGAMDFIPLLNTSVSPSAS